MDELTILIIGIGIGYFWAMYRKDNINLRVTVVPQIDVKAFWAAVEKWRAEHE